MDGLKEKSGLYHLGYVPEVDYQPEPPPRPEITAEQDESAFSLFREREETVAREQLPYGLSDDYEPFYDAWYTRVMDALIGGGGGDKSESSLSSLSSLSPSVSLADESSEN
jgi:hypothetical protein